MKFERVSSVYMLKEDHVVVLEWKFPSIISEFGEISNDSEDGKSRLHLKKGMSWDGSTGAVDTIADMEASLVHDWLCYTNDTVWGTSNSEWKKHRKLGDKEYYRLLRKNGMSYLRAKIRYIAIRSYATIKKML